MVILTRMFAWRGALVNFKPDTFLRLAPLGIPSPPALEIPACRQTSPAQGPAQTHSGDGREELDLG
jgi:hypothetical protein